MTGAPPVLTIVDLEAGYGALTALADIGLTVAEGEAVALIGANGAGKSTLFKVVMGLLKPRRGAVFYRGGDLVGLRPHQRARLGLGYSPEGRRVFPGLTARENLEAAMFAGARERAALLDMAFALFPALAAKQAAPAWQLSGGQQQMLAIARALMGRPTLLLLDEPSLGLSPKLADEVMQAVRRVAGQGTAVLLAEQNVKRSLQCCDRAYVLEVGRVALSGRAEDLRDDPGVRKAFLGG